MPETFAGTSRLTICPTYLEDPETTIIMMIAMYSRLASRRPRPALPVAVTCLDRKDLYAKMNCGFSLVEKAIVLLSPPVAGRIAPNRERPD